MKYLPFLAIIATALAGKSFSAVVIRSGSQYQYAALKTSDSYITAGSGDSVSLLLNSDGTLVDTAANKYVNVADNGDLSLGPYGQKGFSFKDGYLAYDSSESFSVCSGAKVAFDSDDKSCEGVALRIMGEKDTNDVKPSQQNPPALSSSKSEASKSTKAETATKTAQATKTASSEDKSSSKDSSVSPGKKFGLVAIHSGSLVQNAAIKKVDSHPHVFSVGGSEGKDLTLSFLDDKTSLVDQDGRGINLDQNTGEVGDVAPFGRQAATTGFSIKDGYLAYNGNTGFNACPSGGDKYSLSEKDCTGGTSIALKVVYA